MSEPTPVTNPPNDFLLRWYASNQDLGTAAGRRVFYADFDRGMTPEEGNGKTRPCQPEFPPSLLADLDSVLYIIVYIPHQLPNTSTPEVLNATLIELERLGSCTTLYPVPEARSMLFNEAWRKVKSIKEAIDVRLRFMQHTRAQTQSFTRSALAVSRPSHQIGLAPWSQFLVPGAPALRAAGHFPNEPEDSGLQVLTPVANSILDQYERDFARLAGQLGLNPNDPDPDEAGEEFDMEDAEIGLDPNFFANHNPAHEQVGTDIPLTLPEVNDIFSRLYSIPPLVNHPQGGPPAVMAMTMATHQPATAGQRMPVTLLRRRRQQDRQQGGG